MVPELNLNNLNEVLNNNTINEKQSSEEFIQTRKSVTGASLMATFFNLIKLIRLSTRLH